ncbi:MAG: hypothetical protein LC101_05985 [Flavobacteriales bacterium]|nr:hypothetical protein [Flavobacteriales bacterium]MCZ2443305.1 hypothetical protein [Flavobacteriales bacterium]
MKKKAGLWMLGLLTLSLAVNAQKGDDKREEIKKEKREFINQYCGFTDAEAEKFWKVEDDMNKRLNEMRTASRKELKSLKEKGLDNLGDDELKRAMENRKNVEQKMLDIRWEYHQKLMDIVGVKKIAKYYDGEREFRKKLIGELKDKQKEQDDE